MEFSAYSGEPNRIDLPIPWGTQKILLHTEFASTLILHIKYERKIIVDVEEGVNFLCFCNIFDDNRLNDYTENTFLITYQSSVPSKIILLETHSPSNTAILIVQALKFKHTLEYLAKVSLLRTGMMAINKSNISVYPVPVRQFYSKSFTHKGELEILVFEIEINTTTVPGPKHVGNYKWVKIEACVKNCHHPDSVLKRFTYDHSNQMEIRSPFYFYHN
jgi:hypothetical protein